jgi:HEAT repeat protein
VRAAAAESLGKIGDVRATNLLIASLQDWDSRVRAAAAEALGKLGDARAVGALVETMPDWVAKDQVGTALKTLGWTPTSENEDVYIWISAADGTDLNAHWEKTKRVLLADVQTDDRRRIDNAVYTFVSLGKEELIPKLIEVLRTKGTKQMAQAYLHCGNDRLEEAARMTTTLHGDQLASAENPNKVHWGQW